MTRCRCGRLCPTILGVMAPIAGAPANPAAGVRLLRSAGEVVGRDEPIFEIDARSAAQLDVASTYAARQPNIVQFGF